MLTSFCLWMSSWVPPVYAAWSVCRRHVRRPSLLAVAVCLGAMLYVYGVCIVCLLPFVGLTPGRVLGLSALGGLLFLARDLLEWRRGINRPSLRLHRVPRTATTVLCALGIAVIGAVLLWLLWLGIRLPPHFADSTGAHSLGPLTWYTDRLFTWPIEGIESPWLDQPNSYVRLAHLLFYYNIAATGDIGFMSLGQYHALILLLLSVMAACRLLGAGWPAAILAGVACLSVTELQVESLDCYVDVVVAGTIMAALLSIVVCIERVTPARLVALSAACGAAIAVKATSPVQIGPVWTVAFLYGVWQLRRAMGRFPLGPVLLSLMCMAAIGGFWYFACWIRFGNPLYPYQVRIFEYTLFDGFATNSPQAVRLAPFGLTPLTALPFVWCERLAEYSESSAYGGLGPLLPILGIPALLAVLLRSLYQRSRLSLVYVVLVVVVFFLHPAFWYARYVLFLPAATFVAIALLFHWWGRVSKVLIGLLVGACALIGTAWALPYQVSGRAIPPAYWCGALQSVPVAYLAANGCYPGRNPVQQRLLLDARFKGKKILIGTDGMITGNFARRRMDSRLYQFQFRDDREALQRIRKYRIDYLYCERFTPDKVSKWEVFATRYPGVFVSEETSPLDQRLQSYYLYARNYGSHGELFRVDQAAIADLLRRTAPR